MKHIKTFENLVKTYNVGDYVLVTLEHINIEGKGLEIRNKLPTPESDDCLPGVIIEKYDGDNFPYAIKFSNSYIYYIDTDEVLRHLTPEEIEQYKISLETNKYNL